DAAFIAYLAGIPERVGYARDLRSLFLTKAIAVTPEIKKRHQVFYYYNIVKELGGKVPTDPSPRIYIGREDAEWADFFIKKNSLSSSVIVGAAPGASYGPAKRWPAEAYAEVLSRLSSVGCVPIIFGGPEDAETCKAVSEKVRGKHLNLAGGVTLRQFMAILSRLGVFITNDSGPMHIASALGVATVAIFGSTDPTLTGPLSANSMVLIKKADCSPCFDRVCAKGHYRCLSSITVDEVFEAADTLLRAGTGTASGDGGGSE
ncbi:MAG: lipopolysaccharide heptosyltransferase II, partial [Deltaproteobacteria bacterium]